MKQGMELIDFMSQTIDDFRNFFCEDKVVVRFSIRQVIGRSFCFVGAVMKDYGIRMVCEEREELHVDGYPNEFAQVLLNLLSNAKDALVENRIPRPEIVVRLFREVDRAVVTVSDNAGGIDIELVERIFEPYFTTKAKGKGDGIGLYLSKIIIEKHMGGSLTARNIAGGAQIRIELKLPPG
jgi:C4-dicarboxylate-specific signal transduction histidine kinase